MRLEMLELLNTLHKDIVALEMRVAELVQAAEATPDEVAADIMLTVARGDRVKILEMQGRLAALKKGYFERLPPRGMTRLAPRFERARQCGRAKLPLPRRRAGRLW
ncbi:hypothetical protein [Methylobacterium fujisawaense]|uniref:hypothetical protein n=1 Tax=Methylobacterium fujisawaense TaxID=107400 RepID=UPI00313AB835